MEKFVRLTAKVCPLLQPNMNTDQILPARYLKWPRSKGLGTVLFDDLRKDEHGQLRADFPLNDPAYANAKIIIAGRNFGGGSSREAAVYAIYDHGFHCVIAPSFGDIFAQNSVKNGLLTAVVTEDDINGIAGALKTEPSATVDLETQIITCNGKTWPFTIDPVSRNQLLNGWDDVDLTESFRTQITAFKRVYRERRPYLMHE